MTDLPSILSQRAELVTKASDPDYFLEIAEYVNVFLSHKQSKKILSEITKIKTTDSEPYKLAVNTANQLAQSMETELWNVVESDPALGSDQAIIDLRKRWQGLAQGNIMPVDRTDEFLFVVSDLIERLTSSMRNTIPG